LNSREEQITAQGEPSAKKVLMIAYISPPMGGVGSMRIAKFVKYLPNYGWSPVILTVAEGESSTPDYSLYGEIKDKAKIYRTRSIDIPLIYKKFRRQKTPHEPIHDRVIDPKGFLSKAKQLLDDLFLIPDSRNGWIPFGVCKGLEVLRKENIDCIYSTGGPWTNHIIALVLKRLTGKPWLADFRDFWTQDPRFSTKPFFRRLVEKKIEKRVIEVADRVIGVNAPIVEYFKNRYPGTRETLERKFRVIPNGYDPEDFIGYSRIRSRHFIMTYTGSLNRYRSPEPFFAALHDLFSKHPETKKHVRVKFIGDCEQDFHSLLEALNLAENVSFKGFRSHKQTIKESYRSDVLLLFGYSGAFEDLNAQVHVTGKIFEYLATGIPVLAMIREGILSDLMRECGGGSIVEQDNISKLSASIYDLYQKWINDDLFAASRWENIRSYARDGLANQLSSIMSELL